MTEVAQWTQTLELIDRYARSRHHSQKRSSELRDQTAKVRAEALAAKAEAERQIDDLEVLLAALGPAPAAGISPEPASIALQRKRYADALMTYRSQVALAELTATRAASLERGIAAMAREEWITAMLTRGPMPVAPAVLGAALPEVSAVLAAVVQSARDWYRHVPQDGRPRSGLARLFGIGAAALLTAGATCSVLLGQFGRDPAIVRPGSDRRLVAALAEALGRGVVPAMVFLALFLMIRTEILPVPGLFGTVLCSLFLALAGALIVIALPRAVLAPDLPAWRLLPLSPDNARAISRRTVILGTVSAVDLFLRLVGRDLQVSRELALVLGFTITAMEGMAILALSRDGLWTAPGRDGNPGSGDPPPGEGAGNGTVRNGLWFWLRRATAALTTVGLLGFLLGYGALGRYLIGCVLMSGLLIGLLLLIRGLLREAAVMLMRSGLVRRHLAIDHRRRHRAGLWSSILLNPLLVAGGIALIAPLWGLPLADLVHWTGDLLHGFTIGNTRISVTDMLLAGIVFVAAVVLTRMAQRSLADRLLPETQLDPGVQHSVVTGVGYLGVVLSGALAVMVMGINLSNVALIAGALSVGIGFGLQTVVSNFISGLILLVERPLKVGDWVVVGGKEGCVKRISIRATELETYQRSSVIIPNAEILSSALINMTLKDRHGRVDVAVGVAYGTDTGRVRDILLEVGAAHPRVLRQPPPFVLFQDFGPSRLDFELRCYADDVEYRLTVASELRYEIDRRFREAGIEIPFPQQVIHHPPMRPAARPEPVARETTPTVARMDAQDGPPARRSGSSG